MLKEGDEYLHIETTLKKLLKLFEEDAVLEELDLGDTCHPFSGYVDASMLFRPNPKVKEVLRHEYDFGCLIAFSAKIGSLKIKRTAKTPVKTKYTFRVEGPFKTLLKLEHLLIERSALEPGVYKFD